MTTWVHSRKGRITGKVVDGKPGDVFVGIKVAGDHLLSYSGGMEHVDDGAVITVRAEFLREVHDD